MTHAGMFLLTVFALGAAVCLWLYWRERQRVRHLKQILNQLYAARDRLGLSESKIIREINGNPSAILVEIQERRS